MSTKKINYYSSKKIRDTGANYLMILGQRANGKSYEVKRQCLTEAWENNTEFIYLRRWDMDIKQSQIENYFADAPIEAITHHEADCLYVYQKRIWFARTDENGKKIKIRVCGYAIALSQDEHYKSNIFPKVRNIIFEEFISMNYYLPREPSRLQHLASTIFRNTPGRVYLIGNTISRVCPYVAEWGLVNLSRQKQGTIEIYTYITEDIDEDTGEPVTVKIAVEYAESLNHKNNMFFGLTGKNINSGTWETQAQPHLPKNPDKYTEMYRIVIEYDNFKFFCRFLTDSDGSAFWYVEPKTSEIKKGTRTVSNRVHTEYWITQGFKPINDQERLAFNYMLRENKIFFSDNLTGTDFYNCLKDLTSL